jgi:hypothetical protein
MPSYNTSQENPKIKIAHAESVSGVKSIIECTILSLK